MCWILCALAHTVCVSLLVLIREAAQKNMNPNQYQQQLIEYHASEPLQLKQSSLSRALALLYRLQAFTPHYTRNWHQPATNEGE